MSRPLGQAGRGQEEPWTDCRVLSASTDDGLRVAGVRLRDRLARALELAGGDRSAAASLGDLPKPRQAEGRILAVASDALVDPGVLRSLLAEAAEGTVVLAAGDDEAEPAAVAFGAGAGPVPADAQGLSDAVRTARREQRLRRVDACGPCCRVRDAAAARAMSKTLRVALPRPTDGFFARYFDRRLSAPMSVFFARCGARPNAITLLATVVGLAGAWMLASEVFAWRVAGGCVVVFSTILDGCDGEVARLSLRASEAGRRLDLIGDNLVNAAVFVAIAVVALRQDTTAAMELVVAIVLSGVMVAAATGFWFSAWLDRVGLGERARAWYERLTSRDFVYLVLLLAMSDRLGWFLWLAAFGTWSFTALLLVLRAVLIRKGLASVTQAVAGAGRENP